MLTTLTAFREPWEAHIFCGRLNAEGIPSSVAHECHIANAWHYSNALGGVKVLVPDDYLERAREVQQLCGQGEYKSLLEDDLGDLDDVRCPKCGSADYRRRRPVPRAVAAVVISWCLAVICPPIGWICFCKNCGTKYWSGLQPRTANTWLLIWAAACVEAIVLAAPFMLVAVLVVPKFRFALLIVSGMLAMAGVAVWLSRLRPDEE